MRRLNDTARAMLERLRAEGITPTASDIVRINALAHDLESPKMRRQLAKGRPVQLGHAWLWPLTLAATDWYLSTGDQCHDTEQALAYAMAHGHSEGLDTATPKNVKQWARRLRVTQRQLRVAVAEVLDQDDVEHLPPATDKDPATYAQLVRIMTELHGGTIEQWERQVSQAYIFETIEILATQTNAGDQTAAQLMRHKANKVLMLAIEAIKTREDKRNGQK